MAVGLWLPSDKGTMSNSSYTNGDFLYDTDGNPVAIVIGKDENTPWTIYGEQMWIAVAVASKRFNTKVWGVNSFTTVPGLDLSGAVATLSANGTSGDEGTGWYISPNTSEANMDRCPNESVNKQNSEAKTDAMIALNANGQAPTAARSVTWAGGAFDLPRIEVLMRIYQARNRIDAIDPTVGSYSNFSLSKWGFGSSNGANVWSSSVPTISNPTGAWRVRSDGYVYYHDPGTPGRNALYGVIPVVEIPAE